MTRRAYLAVGRPRHVPHRLAVILQLGNAGQHVNTKRHPPVHKDRNRGAVWRRPAARGPAALRQFFSAVDGSHVGIQSSSDCWYGGLLL